MENIAIIIAIISGSLGILDKVIKVGKFIGKHIEIKIK